MKHAWIALATVTLAFSSILTPTFAATTNVALRQEIAKQWRNMNLNLNQDRNVVIRLAKQVEKSSNKSAKAVAITDIQKIKTMINSIHMQRSTVLKDLQSKNRKINTIQAQKAWVRLKASYNNEHKQAELAAKKLTSMINKSASSASGQPYPPAPPAPPSVPSGTTTTTTTTNAPPAPPAPPTP